MSQPESPEKLPSAQVSEADSSPDTPIGTTSQELSPPPKHSSKWRSYGRIVALALLLVVGLIAVYGPQFVPGLWGSAQSATGANTGANGFSYIADLDFWQKTDREIQVFSNAHFDLDNQLTDVPLVLGDWQGKEVPENNQEVMILLDPEQYVQRLYQNSQGQYMWLSMIGGRSSQPFHAPDICYDADGWQYNLSSESIPLDGGGEVHGLWMDASKVFPGKTDKTEQIVFYFYLFPNASRELKDGIVLFKLTSARYGSLEETLKIHADFVRQLFKRAQAPGV